MVRMLDRVIGLRPRWHVLILLTALELLTFWPYYLGVGVVPWDFLGSYLTEAQAWWSRGGIFSPPQWISYAWMGYPAASSIQNSSYYLPIGIVTTALSYTPYVASVLAALQVAFGGLGAYALTKRLGASHAGALLALIGWFYNPLVFSNAEHVDIARGAILLPWVLLVTSPHWWWRRRIGIPAAILVLWQYLIATYPGQIVVAVYLVPIWSIFWAWRCPNRSWLLRLVGASVAAAFLSVVKYGPALALGSGSGGGGRQAIELSWAIIATLFFSYNAPNMPNDISMRPYFLVLPAIMVIGLIRRVSETLPLIALWAGAASLSIFTSVDNSLMRELPGFDLSRFRLDDIKPFLLLPLVCLAAKGLGSIGVLAGVRRHRLWVWLGLVFIGLISFGTAVGGSGARRLVVLLFPSAICVLTVVVLICCSRSGGAVRKRLTAVLLLLSVCSGLGFAYLVHEPWLARRADSERLAYGIELPAVMRVKSCLNVERRRPAREVPKGSRSTYAFSTVALRGAFDCSESVGGYLNVKGNLTRDDQNQQLLSKKGDSLVRFFSAPGAVVPLAGDSFVDLSHICLYDGDCSGLRFTPVSYSQTGAISYRLDVTKPMSVAFNESFYEGWYGVWCDEHDSCKALYLTAGPGESIRADIPKSAVSVRLEYEEPHRWLWRLLGAAGLVLLVVSFFVHNRGDAERESILKA